VVDVTAAGAPEDVAAEFVAAGVIAGDGAAGSVVTVVAAGVSAAGGGLEVTAWVPALVPLPVGGGVVPWGVVPLLGVGVGVGAGVSAGVGVEAGVDGMLALSSTMLLLRTRLSGWAAGAAGSDPAFEPNFTLGGGAGGAPTPAETVIVTVVADPAA
jgi:hypothetical protein